jgi:hypothetical protein
MPEVVHVLEEGGQQLERNYLNLCAKQIAPSELSPSPQAQF